VKLEDRPVLSVQELSESAKRVIDNVERVIVGKQDAVRLTLVAVLCGGHVLIEDVPGVGKTTLTKAIARTIGCGFRRIQFTPDLLPSDVTGVSIFNQRSLEFEFRPGPIMSQFVLADEINRATPKTQSALLEAMEEDQITVDGVTHFLPRPFLVMATQNPIEYEGTFPLPEAQLDRFLLNIRLDYPDPSDEVAILDRLQRRHPIDDLEPVIDPERLMAMQQSIREITVSREIREYIVALVNATRRHKELDLGASPRGSLALFQAAQARAAMSGRNYVEVDDIKALVKPALAHRLILDNLQHDKVKIDSVLDDVLLMTAVPGSPASLIMRG
jgi:MoxR-like ATPase